jgi:predicted MFS family arabinose efflux permease
VPTYWAYGLMFMGTTLVSYALAYFMPYLLRGMGFTQALSQILTFPPYVAAFLWAVLNGVLSDKYRNRSAFIMFNALLNITACAVLGYAPSIGARYFACFLSCMGANANVPLVVGWMHSCISGQSKRAYGSALCIAFGGIGGIVATTAFRTSDAPKYPIGIKTTLALNAMVFVIAGIMATVWHLRNGKANRGELVIAGTPGFRYML